MRPSNRSSGRKILLLGLAVSLVACSVPLPQLQSMSQVGDVQVASAETPIGTPTPLIDPFISAIQGPTSTPTLNLLTPIPPEFLPTPVPMPFTKIVDEADGLPDSEIWVLIIRRADGGHEKYLLPIADIPRDSNEHYLEFRNNLLQPGPGDVVTFEGPPDYFGRNPVNPRYRVTPEATSSPLPDTR